MKYFLDTEFLEGKQDKRIFGFKYGETKPTIDLISIGIVAEDKPAFSNRMGMTDRTFRGNEYYAISKDFNLKEAWNRYDLVEAPTEEGVFTQCKVYWIRENVLRPIFDELWQKSIHDKGFVEKHFGYAGSGFSYSHLKALINWYGKTNKQIAAEIKQFVSVETEPEFWAYYADYDWVVFCQLFGRMVDLPEGFPMYCRDLKQVFDEKNGLKPIDLKDYAAYPKQSAGEHNAIFDARFNKRLYEFLISVK